MTTQRKNPYVGPKPLDKNSTLYGRDNELNELIDLLFAERIVVLHSPSGAGKSSLINAGMIPELGVIKGEEGEEDDEGSFNVFPVLRVNAALPAGEELPADAEVNRFEFSVLLSLEESLPEKERRPLAELAGLGMDEYLDLYHDRLGNTLPDLLIFDQFEEVLTLDSTNPEPKHKFFRRLGQALRKRTRWAIFAIREDYLAALAPYTRAVPTDMKNTFRLDLMSKEGALEAVCGPAQEEGVAFDPKAAKRLVDDLRQVTVMGEDGKPTQTLGPHVEPVQLQVVCHELWRDLPEGTKTIEESLLRDVGDVNQALAGYYSAEVANAEKVTGVEERQIRAWVGTKLITEGGIRGQVLRMEQKAQGLAHAAIDCLVDAHLVRAEPRRGAIWYELTHDRMVAPVQADNEAWRQKNLVPLQLQADLWHQKERPKDLLLRGEALAEATAWAANQQLSQVEADFLEQGQLLADEELRQEELKEAEQRKKDLESAQALAHSRAVAARRLKVGLGATIVFLLAALGATYLAIQARGEAIRQTIKVQKQKKELEKIKAEVQRQKEQLVAFSADGLLHKPLTGSLLITQLIGKKEPHRGISTALALAQKSVPFALFRGHASRLVGADFSPDGKWAVTASTDKTARVWSTDGRGNPLVLKGHSRPLTGACFGPGGKRVITSSMDNTVRVWSVAGGKWSEKAKVDVVELKGHKASVLHADVDPKGQRVVSASADGTVRIWTVESKEAKEYTCGQIPGSAHFSPDGEQIVVGYNDGSARLLGVDGSLVREFKGHHRPLTSVRFSLDGSQIATASADGTVRLWHLAGKTKEIVLSGHRGAVNTVDFNPDGTLLVTASDDATARVWRNDGNLLKVLKGHKSRVIDAHFNKDGTHVVTASWDNSARLWDLTIHEESDMPLSAHEGRLVSARFAPDGKQVLTASIDSTAAVWPVLGPAGQEIIRQGVHGAEVFDVALSRDGKRIVTASEDKVARIWEMTDQGMKVITALPGHQEPVISAQFSPDGTQILTASSDKTARLWNIADSNQVSVMELLGHQSELTKALFSADGKYVVTASRDNTARLWSVAGGQAVLAAVLQAHKDAVLDAHFSLDGKRIITASSDGTARVWNTAVEQGQQPTSILLKGHSDQVVKAQFSRNSALAVTASMDQTARLWKIDPDKAQKLKSLEGHKEAVVDASFSPDGKRVVTASYDKTARVWSTQGGDAPLILKGHATWVKSARFSADGKRIITVAGKDIYVFSSDGKGAPKIFGGHQDEVNQAIFHHDGKSIISASADKTIRVWPATVTWDSLLGLLKERTRTCLLQEQRMRFLAETETAAGEKYQACEQSYGRRATIKKISATKDQIRVTVVLNPKSATVLLDGMRVHTMPIYVPHDQAKHTLTVSAPGHKQETVAFVADKHKVLKISLERTHRAAPARGTPKPKAAEPPKPDMKPPEPPKPVKKPKKPKKPKPGQKPKKPKEPPKAIYFEDEL